jgi:hypothetical protein
MANDFGKIRNSIGNDTVGIAQWIGRKIRNHDPMTNRDRGLRGAGVIKHRALDTGKFPAGAAWVAIAAEAPASAPVVLYSMEDGRLFEVQVREVRREAYAQQKLVAVGN